MVRKLKHHEQKLLKKVDFLQWKSDATLREAHVMRRYLVQDRDDYRKYNRLVGGIRKVGRARALRTRSMRMCVCVTAPALFPLERLSRSCARCRRRPRRARPCPRGC